jgi:hypothetical protein
MKKKKVIVVGGGPAGLIAADILSPYCDVCIIEKEKNVGQKFLVAGKGGFNLTNSAVGKELIDKYLPENFLNEALNQFDSNDLRDWFLNMGISTFIGTSGRVFPEKGVKPIEVLNAVKNKISKAGVKIFIQHKFLSFLDSNNILIHHNGNDLEMKSDYFIFALGGASWSITGSDGKWTNAFKEFGINIKPFNPSNCGINLTWNENIKKHHAGKPLKNIKASIGRFEKIGEAVITDYGLEGNAIYPTIPGIRSKLELNEKAIICLDFKPFNTIEKLSLKINKNKFTPKEYSEVLNLNSAEMAVIKMFSTKESFLNPAAFVKEIKCLNIPVESLRPIEEAISTVGGIPVEEVCSSFSLKKYPNIFTVGEMIDWDAPTGGFLLQGCFSTGYFAAKSILRKEKLI